MGQGQGAEGAEDSGIETFTLVSRPPLQVKLKVAVPGSRSYFTWRLWDSGPRRLER